MTDALKKLIEAVEAGVDTAHHHAAAFPGESAYGHCTWHDSHKASTQESLDAAKELHDNLLPGWIVSLHQTDDGECIVNIRPKDGIQITDSELGPSLSRAWLLAVLRAKLAEGE